MRGNLRVVLAVVLGLLVMGPVGFAIGNLAQNSGNSPSPSVTAEQMGANSEDGTEWEPGPDRIYASIPKESPPASVLDRCREILAVNEKHICSVTLEVDRLRKEGEIPAGDYTKDELAEYVEIPLP